MPPIIIHASIIQVNLLYWLYFLVKITQLTK